MKNFKYVLKKTLKNKVIHYLISRYGTYLIQFINSLLIAVYLGPFYLGVWGFITLMLQYIAQFNLGIPHSASAILSIHYKKNEYAQKIVNSSLTLILILSLVIVLFFLLNIIFEFNLGDEKYNFNQYLPLVVFTGVIGQFNTLFNNVFRVYGKLYEIAFNQSVFPFLTLLAIFIFKDNNLLWSLVVVNAVSFLISLLLFLYRSPVKLKFVINLTFFKTIQLKGWHLFIYNTSFYLIIISTKSFISAHYDVVDFGHFTFAYSLANVILLLLQSFGFLIYPKLINRMANSNNEKVIDLLKKLRSLYITTSHAFIYCAILLYPFFLDFFPEYKNTKEVFILITLSIVLYSNSFGYSGLLISKSNEKLLAKISLIALITNVTIAYILIDVLSVSYSKVIISTMISYLLFVSLLSYYGRKKIGLANNVVDLFRDVFPYKIFIPYFISLFLILYNLGHGYYIIPCILFIILNNKTFLEMKQALKEILDKPSVVNI